MQNILLGTSSNRYIPLHWPRKFSELRLWPILRNWLVPAKFTNHTATFINILSSKYVPLLRPAGLTHEEQSDWRSPRSKLRGRHPLCAEFHTVYRFRKSERNFLHSAGMKKSKWAPTRRSRAKVLSVTLQFVSPRNFPRIKSLYGAPYYQRSY